MGSELEIIEGRLKSFLGQLKVEYGILDRIVYKNKNQHRRCSYFQYLLKVRRDLKLLQSANLEEILSSSFEVISGKRPKQKVNLLESLKRRKCNGRKHNFMERLLGAARLLSQMVEPILKAAMEISALLARSFFMAFCLTVLALLARFRVLVQQILLDVVSVFNVVSSLSQKEHSVKLTQEGFEVFREYYPKNEEIISLACNWETDKFVLFERISKNETNSQDNAPEDVPFSASAMQIQYQSIETLLGGDVISEEEPNQTAEAGAAHIKDVMMDLPESSPIKNDMKAEECTGVDYGPGIAGIKSLLQENDLSSNPLKPKSMSKNKVAFVSVKRPASSAANVIGSCVKTKGSDNGEKEDPFSSLLTGGKLKDSLL